MEARRLAVCGLPSFTREADMGVNFARRTLVVTGMGFALVLAGGACNNREMKTKYQTEIRKISVDTEPAGATVYQLSTISGHRTLLGTTPIKDQSVMVTTGLQVKHVSEGHMQDLVTKLEMVPVVIEKPGYQAYRGNLSTQKGGKVAEHKLKLEPETVKTAAAPTARATP